MVERGAKDTVFGNRSAWGSVYEGVAPAKGGKSTGVRTCHNFQKLTIAVWVGRVS